MSAEDGKPIIDDLLMPGPMKIKLSILSAALAILSLWQCRWDLEELIIVDVFADYWQVSQDGDTIIVQGRLDGLKGESTVAAFGHVWSTTDSTHFPGLDHPERQTIIGQTDARGNFFSRIETARLELNNTYFFWAYAVTSEEKEEFCYPPLKVSTGDISVTTGKPENVILNFFIIGGGLQGLALSRIENHGHLWVRGLNQPDFTFKDTAALEIASTSLGKPVANGPYRSILTNLLPNTQYCVRAYAAAGDTSCYYGDTIQIKTGAIELAITDLKKEGDTILAVVKIGQLSLLNSMPDSLDYEVEYGVVWAESADADPTLENGKIVRGASGLKADGVFRLPLDTLVRAAGGGRILVKAKAYAILTPTDAQNPYRDILYSSSIRQDFDLPASLWENVSGFPGDSRSRAVAFVLNNTAYVGLGDGADKKFYSYNENNGWMILRGEFPGEPRKGAVAFVLREGGADVAYVGLGHEADRSFYRFDGSNWTILDFSTDPNAPSARSGAAAFVVEENTGGIPQAVAYVGLGEGPGVDNKFYKYIPGIGWDGATIDLPAAPRSGAVAFNTGSEVAYVGLGNTADSVFYEYTSGSGWTGEIKFPGGARNGAVTLSVGGTPFVALGESASGYPPDLWKLKMNGGNYEWERVDELFPVFGNLEGGRAFAAGFGINITTISPPRFYGYIGTGENNGNPFASFYRFEAEPE